MTEQSVEEAAHTHARSVVAGDIGTTVRSMTPNGLAAAMAVGNTSWRYQSYELAADGQDGEDQLYRVTYLTDQGRLKLRHRFRNIDGAWKVVDVEKIDD